MYHRKAVLTGQTIELRVVFTDAAGNLIDPDLENVTVYIYDSTIDDEILESEYNAGVFTSAFDTDTATRLSVGYYSLSYEVPSGASEGTWFDIWEAEIDGAKVYQLFEFTVTQGAELSIQPIGNNTVLLVELPPSVGALSGTTLGEKTLLYFSTKYSPLYASPDLIRLELGQWIDYIPDDTLALMAHWSSKEADHIQGYVPGCDSRLDFARTKFVVYDAALKALMIPGQGQAAGYVDGRAKTLGNLSIKDGKPNIAIDQKLLDHIREQRNEWWRVVNAGATIVPGQGLGPEIATKGLYDPDRRVTGRLWEDSDKAAIGPAVNEKIVRDGRRRGRFDFNRWRR